MSSPFRSSDRSPSSQRSTPSRNVQNGNRRVNGYHHRPQRDSGLNDSPSRQLLEEFGRMLINDDRAFKQSLDEQTATQQRLHLEALDRALARHEEVRQSAELARERVELEIERERRRREEEERKAVERARRELEEQRLAEERRKLEETRVRDEERKKQEVLRREQEEARLKAEVQKQQDEQEKARKSAQLKEETDRKARQDAEVKEREQQAQKEKQKAAQLPAAAPGLQPNGVVSAAGPTSTPSQQPPIAPSQIRQSAVAIPKGLISSPQELEANHTRYLDLHKRLKQMREQVAEECKKMGKKEQLSDWRRSIKKCVGQVIKATTDEAKASNRRAMQEIVKHLDAASQVSEPSIDITQYLVTNSQPPNATTTHGPAVLLFLLNHFAKSIIAQFIQEAGSDPKAADYIGVLAVTVFARPQYLFNGESLIDILWARYHRECPVLFGGAQGGDERSREGRVKLGWTQNRDERGTFVKSEEHYVRQTGLGAGFAALTLRDFSRSKNANPAPNRLFWQAMARILDTPGSQAQPTHFVVLRAMVDNSVPRIIATFGGAGLALLRQAVVTFPERRGPQDEKGKKLPAVTALRNLADVLERDLHLSL